MYLIQLRTDFCHWATCSWGGNHDQNMMSMMMAILSLLPFTPPDIYLSELRWSKSKWELKRMRNREITCITDITEQRAGWKLKNISDLSRKNITTYIKIQWTTHWRDQSVGLQQGWNLHWDALKFLSLGGVNVASASLSSRNINHWPNI